MMYALVTEASDEVGVRAVKGNSSVYKPEKSQTWKYSDIDTLICRAN